MHTWERLRDMAEEQRGTLEKLYQEASDARCPFKLCWPSSGDFLSYGNEFQCVRDRHKDGDHEMAEEVWGLPKS